MDLGLKGKVVVVSGSAGKEGSIGVTIINRLAAEGAIPVLLDHNERGAAYADILKANGTNALFCKTDVTDAKQVEAAVDKIIQKYGCIDIVINNVGLNDGVGLDASYEEFINSLKLNLGSYFLLVKYVLPHLKNSKGNILNIGSKVALTGQGGTSGYAAAKGGVLALTREWAVDLIQYGIRSNAIIVAESYTPAYDDWLKTLPDGDAALAKIKKNIPFEVRMTRPEEIADTALFIISNKSSHTTGQFVFVDGGYVHLDRALINDL
ncbi:SDR family oxidoreductase [Flavobacterium subsaxonicum]|uniref:Short-chain dehydrogenase n=1 Tax=Flavobacterium subsaxonicum WB 4.1-42 = DSM 21790 TaxID=1121898 RepID=A0A0A2MLU0_9FLAO|nr:SDR family oxidoreductase [Flavobacterium subsaxonicum]KGO93612.1 short-chain dehydrogenase [Flavobacterium subsaxonicum WB 4.1-42 = DSM 21790]